ncbi:MAG: hypothetical protein IJX92_02530 [Clostridia bacterium]|nr:hypothetical protein [Clostridia bacterium]
MKTKKILAIVITCLLLIGAAVGITVSAAGEPTVSIHTANLSYEGAVRILYTLDTSNVGGDQTIKVVFSDDADVIAPAVSSALNDESYDYVGEKVGVMNIGGTEYPVVLSDGFAPGEMANKVYAIPVVVNADNTVAAVGEMVEFSIYDYCMARFGGACTDDQYNLYTSLLDFGAAVQTAEWKSGVTGEPTVWADAYYGLKTMAGDGTVEVKTFRAPTEHDVVAPKGYEGFAFEAFTDKAGTAYEGAVGNRLTVNVNKPGYTYVKYVYGDTAISMESITATESNPATLANPDTSVTIRSGSEFYIEGDITLAAGTNATLAFNPDVTAINLAEADGVVTVSDGVSSFTMANGSSLKVEYTVLSTTNLTGVIFYYVNGEYVAKRDVTSTANSSFTGVTASVTAGEIKLDYVTVGATSSIMTVNNNVNYTTATFEYSEDGKYMLFSKTAANQSNVSGKINFTYDGTRTNHTVFEAKMKLTSYYYNSSWRNYIDVTLQVLPGQYNIAAPRFIIQQTTVSVAGSATTLDTPIADDGWFDLKIEVIAGTSYIVYINGQSVYTGTLSNANQLGYVSFEPGKDGSGSIYIKDAKFYTVTE